MFFSVAFLPFFAFSENAQHFLLFAFSEEAHHLADGHFLLRQTIPSILWPIAAKVIGQACKKDTFSSTTMVT